MHWIELSSDWWIDIDKAYSIIIWDSGINIKFYDPKDAIILDSRRENYSKILEEIKEVLQSRVDATKENRRMLRLSKGVVE